MGCCLGLGRQPLWETRLTESRGARVTASLEDPPARGLAGRPMPASLAFTLSRCRPGPGPPRDRGCGSVPGKPLQMQSQKPPPPSAQPPDRPHRGMRGCLHQPVGVTVTATAPATALRSQGRPVGLGRDSSFPCRFTKWRKHPPDASALCLRPPASPYARVGWGLCCWASRRPAPPRLLPGCPRPPTCPKGAALPWCPLMLGLPSPPCPTISLPWAAEAWGGRLR